MGTVVMHYLSGLVSTLLKELGLGDDMFNPVSTALLLPYTRILGFLGLRGFLVERMDSENTLSLILSQFLDFWPYGSYVRCFKLQYFQ
jgi:hypothetical protein